MCYRVHCIVSLLDDGTIKKESLLKYHFLRVRQDTMHVLYFRNSVKVKRICV